MSHAKRHATSSRYIKIHLKFLADFSMDQRSRKAARWSETSTLESLTPIAVPLEIPSKMWNFAGRLPPSSVRLLGRARELRACYDYPMHDEWSDWWLLLTFVSCYTTIYIYLMAVPRWRYNPLFMVQEGLWWVVLIGYNWITQQGTNSGVPVVPHKAVAKASKIRNL